MSNPLVCCVMLSDRRREMARRAIAAFKAQTYANRRLVVFSTTGDYPSEMITEPNEEAVSMPSFRGSTIGALRNVANAEAGLLTDCQAIAHWDDDDWSHPNRLAEQVALLQSSGAEAVGYDEMLFWREREEQAWLYTQHSATVVVGSSLMYWRKTWERKPFRNTSSGEDLHFCSGLDVTSVSSLDADGEPRMVCSIHGSNTASVINPAAREWKRVPEHDDYCRKAMSYERKDSHAAVQAQS